MRFTSFNFSFPPRQPRYALSPWSEGLLLMFGLSLLLIHLGDTRVLTRHEVLAAQPAREMLHAGTPREWVLPMLAGVPREAKPPGMMWLIAASIYVFRNEGEWVARLPSALAAMGVALMIGKLAARWFGDRIGRLAGLLQLTFVYTLMQGKLAEADMALAAAVCWGMCSLAIGVIDSPQGRAEERRHRVGFWIAIGVAFLLKGPLGPVFIALATISFALVGRNRRVWKFVADPIGILCCVALVVVWPLWAWRLDPSIPHVWISQMSNAANGTLMREPIYYYVWSVPLMMMPWTPLALIGLRRGPNAELAGAVVSQDDRAELWRFLLCWFVPGILFLTVAMKMKHHHYPISILTPLTIPTALGLDYYARRQTSRRQGLVWQFFLAGCVTAGVVIWKVGAIAGPMKLPLIRLVVLLGVGGMAALHYERLRRPGWVIACYFATAWAIGVGVQAWVMPVQDDFTYQTDFARMVNGSVGPGVTVYMLGSREEEQEAQYAYYLRFPMQRLSAVMDLPSGGNGPVYAIAPARLVSQVRGMGEVQTLGECAGLRARENEGDRLCLLRITRNRPPTSLPTSPPTAR